MKSHRPGALSCREDPARCTWSTSLRSSIHPKQTPGAGFSPAESTGSQFPQWVNRVLSTGPRRRRDGSAVELSLAPGLLQSTCWRWQDPMGVRAPPRPAPHSPIRPARLPRLAGPEQQCCRRQWVAQSPRPLCAQAHPSRWSPVHSGGGGAASWWPPSCATRAQGACTGAGN